MASVCKFAASSAVKLCTSIAVSQRLNVVSAVDLLKKYFTEHYVTLKHSIFVETTGVISRG